MRLATEGNFISGCSSVQSQHHGMSHRHGYSVQKWGQYRTNFLNFEKKPNFENQAFFQNLETGPPAEAPCLFPIRDVFERKPFEAPFLFPE